MVTVLDFLPPLHSWIWIFALYLQALLLHPRFPAGLSRVLRALLTPLSVSLAYNAPSDGFHPRNVTRGFNAGFAFMSVYGIAKALEWGLVGDRTEYDWVGFGAGAVKAQEEEKEGEKQGEPAKPDLITEARKKESWTKVLLSQGHLLFAFRHLGYRSYTGKPPKPVTTSSFLRRTIMRAIGTHIGFTLAMAFVTSEVGDRPVYLCTLVPSLLRHPRALEITSDLVAFTSIGLLAWNGLALAHALLSLIFYGLHGLGKALGLPVDPFEPREFPPLFKHTYRPTSVKKLWGSNWHQILRRTPFQLFGGQAYVAVKTVTGKKTLAQVASGLAVAAMTAGIHEYSIQVSTHNLPLLAPRDSFLARNGGHLFFALQAALTVLEQAFTAATGRKVRGLTGFLWMASTVGPGMLFLLWPSWYPTDLIHAIPPPQQWGWTRWLVPLLCATPPPLWMNK